MDDAVAQRLHTLEQVAVSTAAHADALQLYVQRLEQVLRRLAADEALLVDLERAQEEAVASCERVAAMSKALADVRVDARRGPPRAATAAAALAIDAHSSVEEILRFSRVAESFSGESDATTAIRHAVDSAEAQLARAREALLRADQSSVRNKLRALESLKAACATVDVKSVLNNTFAHYQFPDAADQYFFACDGMDSTHAAQQQDGLGEDDGQMPNEDGRLDVLDVYRQSASRLTLRIADALDALSQNVEDHVNGNAPEESLMYACEFSARLTDSEDDSVQFSNFIQSIPSSQTAYSLMRDEYEVMKQQFSTRKCALPWPRSALNSDIHVALPPHWSTARLLSSVADEGEDDEEEDDDGNERDPALEKPPLLPPVKHMLTRRFSAENAAELCKLERLRVRLQETIVENVLQSTLLHDRDGHQGAALAAESNDRVYDRLRHYRNLRSPWPTLTHASPLQQQ